MGRITDIAWTAVPVPELRGLERCPTPGCRADLFVVDGVTYHPGATFNPWWGCVKAGPECANCYAKAFDHRLNGGHWGKDAPRRFFGDKHWNDPVRLDRHAEQLGVRLRVFCASMADVFEHRPDLVEHRHRLWRLIAGTPHIDWLLLTKQPGNIERMVPWHNWAGPEADALVEVLPPYKNVWLGVTAGTQAGADERIPLLRRTGAALHFVSYEPALEAVDFSEYMWPVHPQWQVRHGTLENALKVAPETVTYHRQGLVSADARLIKWLIGGSESGPKARPAELDWYRAARLQCDRAGVPFLLKQFAENGRKVPLPLLDGRQHFAFPEIV